MGDKIVIIDYGMGNLRSVQKAFERIRVPVIITDKHALIENAAKIILPGVGHFKNGMQRLKEKGLGNLLTYLVIEKKIPIMGICLGMQLMSKFSEEGDVAGLGWIEANTIRIKLGENSKNHRIPHMGWNTLYELKDSPIWAGTDERDSYYFVHSYHVVCQNPEEVLCKTNYGISFHSGFIKENIIGYQFHPEKSHTTGLKLIMNFSGL
jgi:glutamine amidotransferase